MRSLALYLSLALSAAAQTPLTSNGAIAMPPVAGVGPTGVIIDQSSLTFPPSRYSVSVVAAAPPPPGCTWVFETSSDRLSWTATTPPMDCTASWTYWSQYRLGFIFGRINVLSYTPGGGVNFVYTVGR